MFQQATVTTMNATNTIAYLGPAGTFTEAAFLGFAQRGHFGKHYEGLACRNPREAIDAVRAGQAAYACVAIENSVDGAVTPTFDALGTGTVTGTSTGAAAAPGADRGVQIYDELDLSIAFSIMVKPGVKLESAKTFATHPVAYQQVKAWIEEHAPHLEFRAASSNAAAAAQVAAGEVDVAAAPERAAALYGLESIAHNVADVSGARTRFVLVGPVGPPTPPTGADRTSVLFSLRNVPGALVGALTEFSLRDVDLTRIESRPLENGLGTYRFYADIRGHIADHNVGEALRALYLRCEQLTFLGSWPARDELEAPAGSDANIIAANKWLEAARKGNS